MAKKQRPQILLHTIGIFYVLICILPFLIVLSASFTSPLDLNDYGYRIFPED